MKAIEFPGLALTIKQETLELYVRDLGKVINEPKPELPINIQLLKKPLPLENVSPKIVFEHLAAGHNIFVAFYNNRPVGYLFTTTSRSWVAEIRDHFVVAPQEVYLFNAYVYRMFRGKRVYQTMLTFILKYYRKKSYTKALIFTTQNNVNSRNGIEKAGFKRFRYVHFKNFLGRRSWQYSRRNSDSQSYFSHEVSTNE